MKAKILGLFSVLILCSCISGSAETSICKTNAFNADNIKVEETNSNTIEYRITQNISPQLKEVEEIGKVSIEKSLAQINSTTDFNWAQHISVFIEGKTLNYPKIQLIDQSIPASSKEIKLEILVTSTVVYDYLSQGDVEFTFIFTGSLPINVNFDSSICFDAKIDVDKSLNDLK